MKRMIEMELGPDGVAYVENALKGWPGLAEYTSRLPLWQGKVFSLVPVGTSRLRAQRVEEGGLGSEGWDIEWLTDYLMRRLKKNPYFSVIVQDTTAMAEDKSTRKSKKKIFFKNSHVYSYLSSSDFSEISVSEAIYGSSGFTILGFLVGGALDEGRVLNKEVDENLFLEMSKNIEEILVSAYDRESFLLWHPGD